MRMCTRTRILSALAAILVAACGGDKSPSKPAGKPAPAKTATPDDGGETPVGDGCEALDLPAPKDGEGVQVFVDMQLDAGEERQVCKLVLPSAAVNVNWTEGVYTHGSHHATLSRTSYRDTIPTRTITGVMKDGSVANDCESLGADWDTQGVITAGHAQGESAETTFPRKGELPDDVAMKIAGNEVLLLNFHMFNTSDQPVHACYKQNLYGIPDDQVKQEAGSMFYYDSYITVPASGTSTATMACPVQHDVTLAAQVSHMHRRGDGYTATLLDGDPLSGGAEVQKLYEGTDWAEPVVKVNTPTIALKTGQWIKWQCHYSNTETRDVAQGQQTTDEMCMFVGTYWPRSPEMDWCMPAGGSGLAQAYTSGRVLGDGTKNGKDMMDCWSKSPKLVNGGGPSSNAGRYATQTCVTQSCPAASGHFMDALTGRVDPASLSCD